MPIEKDDCFQCGEKITLENNGMIINADTTQEMAQCNDCHYIEYGYNIWPILLKYKL